jgi:predicted nucleic acid-binding protein
MPLGRRREAIEARAKLLFDTKFPGRVLPFDENAAAHYGAIMSMRRAIGRPLEGFDGLIAAVARARDAIVATRNTRDFDGCGIEVLNPWANPG